MCGLGSGFLRRGLLTVVFAAVALRLHAGDPLRHAYDAVRAGNLDGAVSLAKQALTQDPRSVRAYMILGDVAAQRREWDLAKSSFEAVVNLAPSNPYGLSHLGQVYFQQQDWEKAALNLTRALETDHPDHERLAIQLAIAQSELGKPEQVLATLRKTATPTDTALAARYYAVEAFAHEKMAALGSSIVAMRRAVKFDGSNQRYWEFLISALLRTDKENQALAAAMDAQKRFPDNPHIQFLFGLASYRVRGSPLTGLALRNLREAEPESSRALLLEGLLHHREGRRDGARRAFAAAADDDVPEAHLLLGMVLKEFGDYAAAEQEFRKEEQLNPHHGLLFLELGKVLLLQEKTPESLSYLRKAVAYMPNTAAAHYQLGRVYTLLGQKEKANHHFHQFAAIKKNRADLVTHFGPGNEP